MATTSQSIPLAVKGEAPSLVQAEYANKVITPLNGLLAMKVAPLAGMGFFAYAGGQAILDLTAADQRFRNLEGAAVDLSNIYARLNAIENTVNDIIDSLDNASISANASCDNAGTITVNVTLTIPNIPSPI
jgi:hypothetical protein